MNDLERTGTPEVGQRVSVTITGKVSTGCDRDGVWILTFPGAGGERILFVSANLPWEPAPEPIPVGALGLAPQSNLLVIFWSGAEWCWADGDPVSNQAACIRHPSGLVLPGLPWVTP